MNGYDLAYGVGLLMAAPVWAVRAKSRLKVLSAFRSRMAREPNPRDPARPGILIHAVSLGEINATRALVSMLRQSHPDLQIVVSATTDTGYARGLELYRGQEDVSVIRFPLDFSGAINRLLDAIRPSLVVLMELELWPNFMRQHERRRVPVILINGRMTSSAYRNYRLGRAVTRRMFQRLAIACVQDQTYSERFLACGVPQDRLRITGTMKFDTAQVTDRIEGDDALARAVGLSPADDQILVCGSTGPGEEELLLGLYRKLLNAHPRLRLVIVPRKPERFEEVAKLIQDQGWPLVRRSKPVLLEPGEGPAIVLGDTMGELRKFYSLASVVFVGRTMVDLGPRQWGSDMIEPAALGKPVIVGPFTGNFEDVMARFREKKAILEARNSEELAQGIERCLTDGDAARAMGTRAVEVVRAGQGATRQHAEIILGMLGANETTRS